MSELQDFVRMKRDELQALIAPLLARRQDLEKEMRALTEQIEGLLPQFDELNSTAKHLGIGPSINIPIQEKQIKEVTIKQAARLVLHVYKDGLSSAHLHDQINQSFFGGGLDRTSFSPQLSRMRRDNEVDLVNGVWTLTKHGAAIMGDPNRFNLDLIRRSKENEPSGAGAPNGSDAGPDGHLFD